MSDEILQRIRQAVLQMRSFGSPSQELKAILAPDVYEALYKDASGHKASMFMQFEGIKIVAVPEMPEGEIVMVPAGVPTEIALELVKERKRCEQIENNGQFTVADERQAEWLNYLERKKYLVVKKTEIIDGRVTKTIDFTDEGKRYLDSEKGEQDKNWFFETGKLPRE